MPPRAPLSDGDLEILELLWTQGAVTLSEAHQAIERDVGYTTVQTRLERLVRKGLAAKSTERPAKYRAVVTRDEAATQRLAPLVDRVHSGRVVPLVANLIEQSRLTPEEVAELRKLLEEAEKGAASPRKKRP